MTSTFLKFLHGFILISSNLVGVDATISFPAQGKVGRASAPAYICFHVSFSCFQYYIRLLSKPECDVRVQANQTTYADTNFYQSMSFMIYSIHWEDMQKSVASRTPYLKYLWDYLKLIYLPSLLEKKSHFQIIELLLGIWEGEEHIFGKRGLMPGLIC